MKNSYDIIIIGSGSGGLGASCWTSQYTEDYLVVEAGDKLPLNLHNGVHYLHSVPMLPFNPSIKEITLTDGIIMHDGSIKHDVTLEDALSYSKKVREIQHPSSIMEIGKRNKAFLPPSNTLNSLLTEMFDHSGYEHFEFDKKVSKIDLKGSVTIDGEEYKFKYLINTMPLDNFLKLFTEDIDFKFDFKYNPIHVANVGIDNIVPNWIINLYVPEADEPIYRISILNGVVSVESIEQLSDTYIRRKLPYLLKHFQINLDSIEKYDWEKGKIISMDIDSRKDLLEEL